MRKLLGLLLMGFIVQLLFYCSQINKKPFVSFLNVGQGDATLIKTSKGKLILIDAGPNFEVSNYISELFLFNECRLDSVFITHPHKDHYFGLSRLVNYCNVKNIYVANFYVAADDYLRAISSATTETFILQRGDVLSIDEIFIKVLWPPNGYFSEDLNSLSLVMLIESPNTTILMTGDVASTVLDNIVGEVAPTWAQKPLLIYKFPHHGSLASLNTNIFKAYKPDYIVIPVGKENAFGHPDKEVITYLRSYDYKYFLTYLGNVVFPL
ncbi:MAG: ComEC/Rec2 family competence protein [Patescibacteria group bacterium]